MHGQHAAGAACADHACLAAAQASVQLHPPSSESCTILPPAMSCCVCVSVTYPLCPFSCCATCCTWSAGASLTERSTLQSTLTRPHLDMTEEEQSSQLNCTRGTQCLLCLCFNIRQCTALAAGRTGPSCKQRHVDLGEAATQFRSNGMGVACRRDVCAAVVECYDVRNVCLQSAADTHTAAIA
jgi:hypothetical protein